MLKRFAAAAAVVCAVASVGLGASVEKLGQPCRAFNVLSGRIVKDPSSGRELLAMMNMNETSGSELLLVDFEKNDGRVFRAPAGAGAWALIAVPGDRLVAGTYYDGTVMVFDLKKMEWVESKRLGKEEYFWSFAIGGDGRVYGGTYRGGKLGAFDPKTNELEDLGRPAEAAPNLYLRHTSATPDGRILCHWGMNNLMSMLFNPKTKKFEAVPEALKGVKEGVTWNGYFVAGSKVYKGAGFEEVTPPPFPVPTGGKGEWQVEVYGTTPEVLFLRQGDVLYRYKAGEKELTKVTGEGLSGGRVFGGTASGVVLGLRGRDYLTIRPGGDGKVERRAIPVETAPRSTHFLRADDKGRVWGGPTFGQTVFYMDAKSGKSVNTSQVSNSGGEVYDAAFIGDKTYLVAYAGGDIIEFDPGKEWDQIGNKNPRVMTSLKGRGYIRPNAGVMVGPDGKLYAGWMTQYGKYGGAVSVTDPKTGKTELIENPLGAYSVDGAASDGKAIYVSTGLGGNGLPAQKGPAKFGVLDPGTKEVVFQKELDVPGSANNLVWDPATGKVAFAAGGVWHVYDPATKGLTKPGVAKVTSHMLPGVHGGKVYYGSGKDVMVLDLASGAGAKVVEAPGKVETITANRAGEIFISCGVDVYRVRL